MDIESQIAKFEQLLEKLDTELPIVVREIAANDIVALVTNRVVQKGENFQGNAFTEYSDKEVGAFRFVAKSRTNSADKKVRDLARRKELLSYKDFRKLNGLKSDKKNFEFTGNMFRQFGVIATKKTDKGFLIQIGGTTSEAQDKIDKNTELEGLSIIEANPEEAAFVQEGIQEWLNNQANNILNS